MPRSAKPKLKEFARRLLEYEAAAGQRASADGSTACQVCETLRQPLSKVLGTAGFSTLFSRALTLAKDDVAWLRLTHIDADGSLNGLAEVAVKLDADEIASGEVVLVARLLELLVTFIGPALTLELIQDVWPKASFGGGDL
jgi:hypothetical protein